MNLNHQKPDLAHHVEQIERERLELVGAMQQTATRLADACTSYQDTHELTSTCLMDVQNLSLAVAAQSSRLGKLTREIESWSPKATR